jgi:antitoxin (DNA-binding transcriptional repressor) of toxin-antitoxin stability system
MMTHMSNPSEQEELGVAEAKARFSELIERVTQGERFVISRRGRPVLALVRPGDAKPRATGPAGLLAVAGALEDWEDLPAAVADVYAQRRRSRDRKPPEFD